MAGKTLYKFQDVQMIMEENGAIPATEERKSSCEAFPGGRPCAASSARPKCRQSGG